MMLSKKQKKSTLSPTIIDDEKLKVRLMLTHEHSLSSFLKEHIKHDMWIRNVNLENGLTYIIRQTNEEIDEVDLILLIDFLYMNAPNLLVYLLNEKTVHNDTCLTMAIYTDKRELAKKMIRMNLVDLNFVNSKKMTPLMLSILKEFSDVSLTIVDSEKDYLPDFVSEAGYTPLMGVCFNGWSDIAHKLLDKGKCNIGKVNKENKNAFTFAVMKDMNDICYRLLDSEDNDPGIIEDVQQITPLFYAILRKNEELAIRILETGRSRPDLTTKMNETCLMMACHFQMKELAHKLLDTGKSRLEVISHLKYNAFIYSCQYEDFFDISVRILNMMVENKFEGIINALLWTVFHENIRLTKYLIENVKLEVFDVDEDGDHPLIVAVRKKNQELVSYLLPFYDFEQVMKKNKEDKNAIDYSIEENDSDIFDILSEKVGYQHVMDSFE